MDGVLFGKTDIKENIILRLLVNQKLGIKTSKILKKVKQNLFIQEHLFLAIKLIIPKENYNLNKNILTIKQNNSKVLLDLKEEDFKKIKFVFLKMKFNN